MFLERFNSTLYTLREEMLEDVISDDGGGDENGAE